MNRILVLSQTLCILVSCRGAHDNPHARRHVTQGALALRDREPDLAQRHFEMALQYDPTDPPALVGLGIVYMLEQEPRRARWLFEEAIRQKPDYPEAHANLGALLWNQDRIGPALRHLRTALYLDPGNDAARWNLAMIHLRRREPAAAAVHLGWYCARRGHPREAVRLWARALEASGQARRAREVRRRLGAGP